MRENARDHPDTGGSADLWSDRKASAECGRSDSTRPENATDKFPFAHRRSQPNREEFLCAVRRGAASPNSSVTLPEMENQERTQCRLLGIHVRCGDPRLRSRKFVLFSYAIQVERKFRDHSRREFRQARNGSRASDDACRDERLRLQFRELRILPARSNKSPDFPPFT